MGPRVRSGARSGAHGPDRAAGGIAERVRTAAEAQRRYWGVRWRRKFGLAGHRLVTSPEVLTHCDYWSGNVVWRDGRLTGIVDWAGGSRGPRGFDLGWCRLDLILLFDEQIADDFLAAYEAGTGQAVGEIRLWDCWAAAYSDDAVGSWAPNYLPLGRADLDEDELRRRHAQWTARIRERR